VDAVSADSDHGARPLSKEDIERLLTIDRAHVGHSRRRFFDKRFAAASAHPDDFIHFGVMRGGSLRGFVMARIVRGEFGREDAIAVLDALGVEPVSQERGIGQALIDELARVLRGRGVASLHSQAEWKNHNLLRFFDASGFRLAPRLGLERPVAELFEEPTAED
jgi:ribosomal protein S18 acetylase RimI-like enzyme